MDADTALYAPGDVARLIEKHHDYVIRRLTALVGDRVNAEDVAQQVYADLRETAAEFDATQWTFKQWLNRTIKHRGIEAWQNSRTPEERRCDDIKDAVLQEVMEEIGDAWEPDGEFSRRMAEKLTAAGLDPDDWE